MKTRTQSRRLTFAARASARRGIHNSQSRLRARRSERLLRLNQSLVYLTDWPALRCESSNWTRIINVVARSRTSRTGQLLLLDSTRLDSSGEKINCARAKFACDRPQNCAETATKWLASPAFGHTRSSGDKLQRSMHQNDNNNNN